MRAMTDRFRYAWHVLRGRPLIYRCEFRGQVDIVGPHHVWVIENVFRGSSHA